MKKSFLVALPMGTGKTRLVLNSILHGAKKSKRSLNMRLERTIILGPNERVKHAWIRELMLLMKRAGYILDYSDSECREMTLSGLQSILRSHGFKLPFFTTYNKIANRLPIKSCHYLVLDEWHRCGRTILAQCKKYIYEQVKRGWLIGGSKVKKNIYFVSATPVNPVLEQEEVNEQPLDLDTFKKRMTIAVKSAASIVYGITGRTCKIEGCSFRKAINLTGIKEMIPQRSITHPWRFPSEVPISLEQELALHELIDLKRYLQQGSNGDIAYKDEYVCAVGLVRTKKVDGKHVVSYSRAGRAKKSFGIIYSDVHIPSGEGLSPYKKRTHAADKWLLNEHTRLKRLLNWLIALKILLRLKGSSDKLELPTVKPTGKKVIIFCIHQGVAKGLVNALDHIMRESPSKYARQDMPDVATNVGVSSERQERYRQEFNKENSPPYILVVTDSFSESIDLHESCKLMVHYELPWSPIRLFQRIGRLTRLKDYNGTYKFNKNVQVSHIVLPGSVEEERVNRLVRRIDFLHEQNLWPKGFSLKSIIKGLIGSGPSMHYNEIKQY